MISLFVNIKALFFVYVMTVFSTYISYSQSRLEFYGSYSHTLNSTQVNSLYRKDLEWVKLNQILRPKFIENRQGFYLNAGVRYKMRKNIFLQSGLGIIFQFYRAFEYYQFVDIVTRINEQKWHKAEGLESSMLEMPILISGKFPTRWNWDWVWKTGVSCGYDVSGIFQSNFTYSGFYGIFPEKYQFIREANTIGSGTTPVGMNPRPANNFDYLTTANNFVSSGLLSYGIEMPVHKNSRLQIAVDAQRNFQRNMMFKYQFTPAFLTEDQINEYIPGKKFRYWRMGLTISYFFSKSE